MGSTGKAPGDLVTTLTSNDVLCGRGSGPNDHAGNIQFRELISVRKKEYLSTNTRNTKARIAREIVDHVEKSLVPPGRFLKKLDAASVRAAGYARGTDVWMIVDEDTALEKAKQALRQNRSEKSPTPASKTVNAGMSGVGVAPSAPTPASSTTTTGGNVVPNNNPYSGHGTQPGGTNSPMPPPVRSSEARIWEFHQEQQRQYETGQPYHNYPPQDVGGTNSAYHHMPPPPHGDPVYQGQYYPPPEGPIQYSVDGAGAGAGAGGDMPPPKPYESGVAGNIPPPLEEDDGRNGYSRYSSYRQSFTVNDLEPSGNHYHRQNQYGDNNNNLYTNDAAHRPTATSDSKPDNVPSNESMAVSGLDPIPLNQEAESLQISSSTMKIFNSLESSQDSGALAQRDASSSSPTTQSQQQPTPQTPNKKDHFEQTHSSPVKVEITTEGIESTSEDSTNNPTTNNNNNNGPSPSPLPSNGSDFPPAHRVPFADWHYRKESSKFSLNSGSRPGSRRTLRSSSAISDMSISLSELSIDEPGLPRNPSVSLDGGGNNRVSQYQGKGGPPETIKEGSSSRGDIALSTTTGSAATRGTAANNKGGKINFAPSKTKEGGDSSGNGSDLAIDPRPVGLMEENPDFESFRQSEMSILQTAISGGGYHSSFNSSMMSGMSATSVLMMSGGIECTFDANDATATKAADITSKANNAAGPKSAEKPSKV